MTTATSSSSASIRSIDVNGVALFYEEQGEGDSLILIHGGWYPAPCGDGGAPSSLWLPPDHAR